MGDAKFIGLSNYVKLFVGNNDGFGSALLNSFILAFLSVFVQLTLSLVLALAITYPKVKKQERFYRTVYFLPAIVSTVIIAELWKKIYHPSYGLLNSFLGMLGLESWQREWLGDTETALIAVFIPIVWQYIGNHMLMMYSAIKGLYRRRILFADVLSSDDPDDQGHDHRLRYLCHRRLAEGVRPGIRHDEWWATACH